MLKNSNLKMRDRDPKIINSFEIVEISMVVTLIRIFLFIMTIAPIILAEMVPSKYQTFIRSLSLVFIIALFVFVHLKSNYKKIGYLDFYEDFFQISISNNIIRSSEETKLNIRYSGYEGDHYWLPGTLFEIVRVDGINEIHLETNNRKLNYKFRSVDKRDLNSLISFKSKFKGQMVIDMSRW